MFESPVQKASSLLSLLQASLGPSLAKHPHPHPHPPGTDDAAAPPSEVLLELQQLGVKDYATLLHFAQTAVTGAAEDDSRLMLERLIQLLAKLPPHARETRQLSDGVVRQLWATLDHPPATSLGAQFRFRHADGSHTSIANPQLGAANTPYARSVTPAALQNPDLPDPAVIFDRLMARGEPGGDGSSAFEPHPQGLSSMLFYLATIIIHDLFQTSHDDYSINMTSSYLDLAPLYGRNDREVGEMRMHRDGLLKADCFSSTRILGFPPGVAVFMVMFNRFHNYVVTQLALINEGGRFTKPPSDDETYEAAWQQYDEELFQTGRLVTCGLYVNIILKDYVGTILALNRTDSAWSLDPRTDDSGASTLLTRGAGVPERGVGNQCAAEFNLIYRWHSVISPRDEQWTLAELRRILHGRDPATATTGELFGAMGAWAAEMPEDPAARTFAGLQRHAADGTFDDGELAQLLRAGVDDAAGAFGANRVPRCMKAIEVLGMQQARAWRVGTLNELRAFVGLARHAAFEDINPDPAVAASLRQLYGSPDAVEMYPGLVAERAKPPLTPGSGLCGGATATRAILSDAVALVRGDRFCTTDYTPALLTNWGFREVDSGDGERGHAMATLILRALPGHFAANSIYARCPFVTPRENRAIMTRLGRASQYTWEAPRKPAARAVVVVRSHRAVRQILDNTADFKPIDTSVDSDNIITRSLFPQPRDARVFLGVAAAQLLAHHGAPVSRKTREVDVVRDVFALAAARLCAAVWALPIDTKTGACSEQQLARMLLGDAPTQQLAAALTLRAEVLRAEASSGFVVGGIMRTVRGGIDMLMPGGGGGGALRACGDAMVQRALRDEGGSAEEAVRAAVVPAAMACAARVVAALAWAVDYYLGAEGSAHLGAMRRLAREDSPAADDKLMKYLLEGMRLNASTALHRQLAGAAHHTVKDHVPSHVDGATGAAVPKDAAKATRNTLHKLKAGDRVLLDVTAAHRDAAVFAAPGAVRLDRERGAYLFDGAVDEVVVGAFKAVVGLRNLRRAPGARGAIRSFARVEWRGQVGREADDREKEAWSGLRTCLSGDQSRVVGVPSSMRVWYDE